MNISKIFAAPLKCIWFKSGRSFVVPAAVMLMGCVALCRGTTFTALSANEIDVSSKVSLATDGDTVIIPPGTAHWTTSLYINKGITLQGAGTNSTIIIDDIPDADVNAPGYASSLINFDTTLNKFYRLTGIQIPTNTVRVANSLGIAQVVVSGTGKAVRIDHCLFTGTALRQRAVTWYGAVGVVDHCSFVFCERSVDLFGASYGDPNWASPSAMGTTNEVYIEDCNFIGASSTTAFTDCFDGGRYCVRYCTSHDGHFDSHEGGSRTRGTREVEIYMNNLSADDGNGLLSYLRSGSTVVWSNNMTGAFLNLTVLANYRSFVPYTPWGGISGTNVWDNNASAPSATGTYSGTNGATTVLVDSSANWTVNQWVGYTVQNTTAGAVQPFAPYQQMFGVILANTANTLTTYDSGSGQLIWRNGNTYAIYYVTNGLDMCGVGQGDLIQDTSPGNSIPVNTATGTAAWPHQQLEPCYQWGNTPSNLGFSAQFGITKKNINYYDNTVKPNYTPLIYPHPLVGVVSQSSLIMLPPNNLFAGPVVATQ